MKFLTAWQEWFDPRRRESRFHCDLILAPGEWVSIYTSGGQKFVIWSPVQYGKIHLAASWEFRDTEFAEEPPAARG